MATPSKIDLAKFLADPSYQEDRDFLESFMTHVLEKKAKEAEEKAKQDSANQPQNVFDRIFGRRS